MQCVHRTIRRRRTIYAFSPDPVPKAALEAALDAAVWAPDHGLKAPWRFYVPGSRTRTALAALYARLRADKRADPGTDLWRRTFDRAQARFLAIPAMIMVGCERAQDAQAQREREAAVSCAIQNMLLTLWEQGYGSQWSTGPVVFHDTTRALLGVAPQVDLVAAVYVGKPAETPESRRTSWREKTVFLP